MDSFRNRFNVFLIIISIIAALVGVQLILFQIVQHVDSQRDVPELLKVKPAPRGRIYDRNGYLLSGDEAHFELAYDRSGANYDRFIKELASTIGITASEILALKDQPAIIHKQLIKDLPYDLGNHVRETDVWGFIADDVHIVQHFDHVQRESGSARQAFISSVTHLFAPLLGASVTTALGLASLATSDVVAVRTFGIGAAIGDGRLRHLPGVRGEPADPREAGPGAAAAGEVAAGAAAARAASPLRTLAWCW